VILPLFALFGADVVIDSGVAMALAHPVGLGVLFGPLIGTQVGITAASWIVVRFGLMPSGVNSGQIHGSAIPAGVGFTMSLFVSDLAFGSELLIRFSKVGIRAGSALCVAVGYYVLRSALELEARPSKRATAKRSRQKLHRSAFGLHLGKRGDCVILRT
jgi:NhaA family Na+:H+ antiporter